MRDLPHGSGFSKCLIFDTTLSAMKTFLTIAFALGAVLLLGWIAFESFKTDPNQSSLTMHPSNFEKPDVVRVVDATVNEEEVLSFAELIEEEE